MMHFQALLDRVFPRAPDFFALLHEQSEQVLMSVDVFLAFMESGDARLGEQVRENEHAADRIKARNLHTLNEAFCTPMDREDIYRAITDLDRIVSYCKTTVHEMHVLELAADVHSIAMARELREGTAAVVQGFGLLGVRPLDAIPSADAGRWAERRVEKLYRQALGELFHGDDYLGMLKRRELYRHLSNAADRLAHCANTLHDIVVKL